MEVETHGLEVAGGSDDPGTVVWDTSVVGVIVETVILGSEVLG